MDHPPRYGTTWLHCLLSESHFISILCRIDTVDGINAPVGTWLVYPILIPLFTLSIVFNWCRISILPSMKLFKVKHPSMIISGNCCLLWSPALALCLGALFGAPPAAAASQHRVLQHCHQRMPLAASLADDPRKSNGASGWVQIGCWQISQDDTGGTQVKQLQQEWLSEWGNHQQELKNELVEKHMQHMASIKKIDDERNTVHKPSKGNMGNSPKMAPIPLHWDEDGAIRLP